MKINPSGATDNLTSRSSQQPKPNRLILIMTSLLVTLGVGYWGWSKIQLDLAQQLIHNCVKNHNCADNLDSLEFLVKTKNRLKLLNLATANLFGVNLDHAEFDSVNLYGANLGHANLEHAYLKNTNFYRANLDSANLEHAYLINAKNLTPAQIKSACNWSQAFYRGKFDSDKLTWIVDEKTNQQFIQQLQQDKDSDPKTPVDCSEWSELD